MDYEISSDFKNHTKHFESKLVIDEFIKGGKKKKNLTVEEKWTNETIKFKNMTSTKKSIF